MLKRLYQIFAQQGSRKLIFSNFISLSVLQAANYVVPLIAFPYIIKIFGNNLFGQITFAFAFIQYFILIVDFGLEYTATREISKFRDNKNKLQELFNAILIMKLMIFISITIVFVGLVMIIDRFRNDYLLYFLTYGMVLGQSIFPVWLFQGLEKMKFITIFNVLSKLIFTILVFVLVKQKSDYYIYLVLNSLGYIVAGILSFIAAVKIMHHKFVIPSRESVVAIFNQSKNVFISNVGTSLYITSATFILGIVTARNDVVGYYYVAEKAVRGIRYFISPITQAIFPNLSKRFASGNMKNAIADLKKVLLFLFPVLIIMTLLTYVFAGEISALFFGKSNSEIELNIRILAIIILIGTFNNVLGVLGLINLNMEKHFRNYVLISGLFNIIACTILSYYFLDLGTSISVVLSEILLLTLLILRYKKIMNI